MLYEKVVDPNQKISRVEQVVEEVPEVAGLQSYEYLRSAANSQKEAFINGDIDELDFTLPDLDLDAVLRLRDPMLLALRTLMPNETNPKSEALYRAIEYRYTELFMLNMARIMNYDDSSGDEHYTPAEKSEAETEFKLANEALYGKPDKDVFSGLAQKKLVKKLAPKDSDDDGIRTLRAELGNLLGEIDESNYAPFSPDPELVARIGALIHERFDYLVDHIDPAKIYEVADIEQAMKIGLEKLGAIELGWDTKVVPHSSDLSTSAHQRLMEIGENRLALPGQELKGKLLHEEAVHAGRSINAEKAGWISAAYGQDGYLPFEESFATALEDAYNGKFTDHGQDQYLVAGLAYGLDNHGPRDFRETYEIMWRSNALKNTKKGNVSDSEIAKAKSSAFAVCYRMFRGTNGHQKGIIYLKDLAYFQGQEPVWNILKNVHTQADLDILFAGKLDNSRPDHQAIAEQIMSQAA